MHEHLYDKELKLLAKRIKEERKKLGLSQEDFSRNIGISQSQQANIEQNRSIPSVLDIIKICRFLNISPNDLLKHFYSYEDKINICFDENRAKLSDKGFAGVDPIKLDLSSKTVILESLGILKKPKKRKNTR